MSTFPWVQLRLVSRTGTGHTPSRSRPELWEAKARSIPWVTLADVGRLRHGAIDVIYETAENITPAGVAASSAVLHPTGTVILSRTASVGFAGIMGLPMAVSQDYMTWTPGPRLSNRFLLHFLRGSRAQLLGLMHGSTLKTIYMPDLHRLRAPLPPIETQEQIADFLDGECARIRTLAREFVALRASLEESAVESVSRELAQYPVAPLRFRLAGIDQGWSPECDSQLAAPGEWAVLKVGCVNYGRFRPEQHKRLPDTLTPRKAAEVRPGDVLMSRANTSALVGSAAIVDDTGGWRLMISDKHYRLRLMPGVDPTFVTYALNGRSARDQIEVATAGASSSMQNISQDVVRSLRLPNASVDAQVATVRRLSTAQKATADALEELAILESLVVEYRDALITEAVTGKLDVTKLSESRMVESLAAVREGERPEVLSS